MFCSNILFVASLMVLGSFSSALYDEPYRPQFHYSPPAGWMNDPNGLIYYDGIFHLFYQSDPHGLVQGHMHWSHATSRDMIFWKNLKPALVPPKEYAFFSGSTIVDHQNITGFQAYADIKPLVAIFTARNRSSDEEEQWLAYSNDGPEYEHFEFYENNPVIDKLESDSGKPLNFRDPSIYEWENYYVLFIAQDNRSMIYNSDDMKKWELVSEFGEFEGSHEGIWECPSLFPLNVTIDGVQVEKYVLSIVLTGLALPNTQYFIGSFDGKKFTNENPPETTLWIDYGPDSYAGITYNQLHDGRRVFISWMNRWEYAQKLTFNVWNGQMGLMRELKLMQVGAQTRLSTLPVRELKSLRTKQIVSKQNVSIENNYFVADVAANSDDKAELLVDIEMTLDLTHLKSDDSFDIIFSGKNDSLIISLKGNEFSIDRSNAGRTDFPNFGGPWKAPRYVNDSELKLRMIIDRSSIELFADDGLTAMAALFFSKESIASKMEIFVNQSKLGSTIILNELYVYQLKSIWN